ncbi:hypothetical protein E2C01_069066 [Portunus trituberculatus]|uniref:Uncharacterized protein n=1 Tax=Portunus trituberculatus TaxID=210409 RepID=A0A5B7HXL6_PORTR|nr:hypothetical protein [Portunus trituberculatus]
MAKGGRNLENWRDHYFLYPSMDIHPCPGSPITDFIDETAYRDPQPYCDDCLAPLTVRHLLVECPSLTDLRHRYLYRSRGRDSGVYYISRVLGPECLAKGHDYGPKCDPYNDYHWDLGLEERQQHLSAQFRSATLALDPAFTRLGLRIQKKVCGFVFVCVFVYLYFFFFWSSFLLSCILFPYPSTFLCLLSRFYYFFIVSFLFPLYFSYLLICIFFFLVALILLPISLTSTPLHSFPFHPPLLIISCHVSSFLVASSFFFLLSW